MLVQMLPDHSGFTIVSLPLPANHWLLAKHDNVPPMLLRAGKDDGRRNWLADAITSAARYAVRCTTMNGKEKDFDPDSLVQNMVTGLLGYWTADGLSSDALFNPAPPPPTFSELFDPAKKEEQ